MVAPYRIADAVLGKHGKGDQAAERIPCGHFAEPLPKPGKTFLRPMDRFWRRGSRPGRLGKEIGQFGWAVDGKHPETSMTGREEVRRGCREYIMDICWIRVFTGPWTDRTSWGAVGLTQRKQKGQIHTV
jgi:hypothetical protein